MQVFNHVSLIYSELEIYINMPHSILDFPGGSVSKESTCSAGDCLQSRRPRFNPCIRKTPWRRKWQPTPVFLPGESHGERSLAGYSPGVTKNQSQLNYYYHLETNVDLGVQPSSLVWLCNPMDCSTPVFPVPHHLLEFTQVHVHWIGDANYWFYSIQYLVHFEVSLKQSSPYPSRKRLKWSFFFVSMNEKYFHSPYFLNFLNKTLHIFS